MSEVNVSDNSVAEAKGLAGLSSSSTGKLLSCSISACQSSSRITYEWSRVFVILRTPYFPKRLKSRLRDEDLNQTNGRIQWQLYSL